MSFPLALGFVSGKFLRAGGRGRAESGVVNESLDVDDWWDHRRIGSSHSLSRVFSGPAITAFLAIISQFFPIVSFDSISFFGATHQY